MASTRAQDVAEILWELKRAEKVAKFSSIAQRAGFSAGSTGRAMHTCLRTIRRDWPHLQWWRAVKDDGLVEVGSEQEREFREAGFELEAASGQDEFVLLQSFNDHLMQWESETPEGEQNGESEAEVA